MHRHPEPAAAQPQPGAQPPQASTDGHLAALPGVEGEEEDRSKMSTVERTLDWLGRLHPIIVHFPLAFFPAALFTAIMGRRRPAFRKPVQFLVVAGGVIAPLAVLLGWLDGGLALADADPLLRVHRWLGTAIGIAAVALAVWAAITAALVVQGWYGGAMVHGLDHMSW
jgi:uncharacterized membrane protein